MPLSPLKTKTLVLFLLIYCCSHAQQESSIKIDSGNHNTITVVQTGLSDSQRSTIAVKQSDNNLIQSHQIIQATAAKEKTSGFNEWVKNTGALVALFVSIATLTGLIWKGMSYVKKKKAKQ